MVDNAAGTLAIITELLDTNVYDDYGNVIGQKEAITKEEALALLNMGDSCE